MDGNLKQINEGILDGNQEVVKENILEGLQNGLEPQIILDVMIQAMSEVGRRFEEGEYFVPEMLIAAQAMKQGMGILKPSLMDADVKPVGVIVVGTVKGDLHDIGKNLVSMMLEGAGFTVIDLGVDISADKFVQAVRDHHPNIVGMSGLLTTTIPNMKVTIDALKDAGLREQVRIMIGGAPVTEDYARQIGADGYSQDASRAVKLAKILIGKPIDTYVYMKIWQKH